jgi:hypothetical protein
MGSFARVADELKARRDADGRAAVRRTRIKGGRIVKRPRIPCFVS